jgi:hypothetical protein
MFDYLSFGRSLTPHDATPLRLSLKNNRRSGFAPAPAVRLWPRVAKKASYTASFIRQTLAQAHYCAKSRHWRQTTVGAVAHLLSFHT